MLVMSLGSWAERSRVTTSVGLGIQVEPGAFPVDEKHMVPMQPPRPQAPFVVDRILFVVECTFFLQKEIDV